MFHCRLQKTSFFSGIALLIASLMLWSCSGDPSARKQKHLQRGRDYLSSSQFNAAIIEFKNALQIDPQYPEGYYHLGLAHLRKGDWREAHQLLKQAQELKADFKELDVYLAQANLMVGNLDEARSLAEGVLASDPNNSRVLTVLGGAALATKSLDEARDYLHQAIKSDPALAEPHIFLSSLYRANSENARAREELELALQLDEHNLQALYNLAATELAAKNQDAAQKLYERILEVDSQQTTALAQLASILIAKEDYEKARPFTERLIKSRPNLYIGYLLKGFISLKANAFDEAAVDLQKATRLHPGNVQSHFYYGVALHQKGNLQQALSEFQTALQLNPNLTNARLSTALIYTKTGLLDDAIRASQDVLRVRPNDPLASYILGMALLRQGDPDTGYQALEKAIANKPDFTQAYQGKGLYYQLKGELSNAIDSYETALKLDPNTAGARALLILAHLRKKDFKAALGEANRGQELEPENPIYTNLLGVTYGMQGDLRQAEKKFVEAISQKPDFLAPRLNLATLYSSTGRPKKTLGEFHKILEVDQKNLKALQALGQIHEREGQYDKALELYHRAAQISHAPNIMLRLGWLQYRKGAFDEAVIAAENILSRKADHTEALQLLGSAQAALGDLKGALGSLQHVTKQAPKEAAAWNLLGQAAYQAGRLNQAEAAFKRSLAINGDQPLVAVYLALAQRDLDQVISLAQDALAKLPNNAKLRFLLGQVYQHKRRHDEAIKQYNDALRLDPSLWAARLNLANLYLLQGDVAKTKKEVEEILAQNPSNRQALILSGALLEGEGKIDDARQMYKEAAKKKHLQAMLLLARSYMGTREFTKALNVASDAAHLYPKNPLVHEVLGLIYVATKELDKALAAFQRYTELSPNKQVGLNRIAAIQTSIGQYDKAIQAYERSLEVAPDQPLALLGMSKVYLGQGKNDEALELARKVLKNNPNLPLALEWMGNISARQGNVSKAIEYWNKAIEANPGALMIYLKVGFAQLGQGEGERAIETFQRTIKENPEFGPGYIGIAEAYKMANQEDRASKMYEKGLLYSPRSILALNNLAWIYSSRGEKLDKALDLVMRAKNLRPDSAEIADTLGTVHLKKGSYPLALTYFKEAAEGLPENPTVRFHLGVAYAKLGKTEEARAELERSLEIDPNFSEAKEARDILSTLSR